jgi:FMN phosphatase YigB (HAD superfamily)
MLKAILFDLDDTLLGNHMDTFLPSYFGLLGRYAQQLSFDGDFMQALLFSTQAMIADVDPTRLNWDVFRVNFAQMTGLDSAEMEAFFNAFYRDEFPKLQSVTQPRAAARALIQTCVAHDIMAIIATNPLFPATAIEQRLAWAGLPVDSTPLALVTSMDNMHAAKPQLAYYREILDRVGCSPQETLMVGDSWESDIEPAHALGIPAYWIDSGDPLPDPAKVIGSGTLDDFARFLPDYIDSV